MMRLQTYASFSFLATIVVIYHAFSSREQFYPAMVYLSTSNICLVLLLNMGFVIMCILWQLVKLIFLGSLREAEVERLNEQSWREVMEILFAITIFRQDFSVGFLGMITALLLIKALHWLAQKRVEYIETTPTVTMLSHARIVSFLGFLLLIDSIFLYSSVKSLVQTWQASVMLFFSFEYMILATSTLATFIKYTFYVSDMLMEGQWEGKAVYTFYLELIRDLLHLSMYLFFFLVIFMSYGVPLHLIREFYETFRNFKIRVSDYLRYRSITSNINDRFSDATSEELAASDATCIICREEMVTAKKLRCGHLFHVQCLRSWLERQHTCPTCRSSVVSSDTGLSGSGRQHGVPAEHRQPGSQTPGPSAQLTEGAPTNNMTPHQIRVQTAAVAASHYQKSLVHPSPNNYNCYSGYSFSCQGNSPAVVVGGLVGRESLGETSSVGQNLHHPSSNNAQLAFVQIPYCTFSLLQSNSAQQFPQMAFQENLLQQQMKALQSQLQLLQQQHTELQLLQKQMTEGTSLKTMQSASIASSRPVKDQKGKAVADTTPLASSDLSSTSIDKVNGNYD